MSVRAQVRVKKVRAESEQDPNPVADSFGMGKVAGVCATPVTGFGRSDKISPLPDCFVSQPTERPIRLFGRV